MNSVERQVGAAVAAAMGHRLVSVEYLCFPHECEASTELLELDGEIRLYFAEDVVIHFTWTQQPGWNEVNSLLASKSSSYSSDALQTKSVSDLPLWQPLIGSTLRHAEVLGWLQTPAIVRLKFEDRSILIGVGYEAGFRDGDCVLARPDEPTWLHSNIDAEQLWSSGN